MSGNPVKVYRFKVGTEIMLTSKLSPALFSMYRATSDLTFTGSPMFTAICMEDGVEYHLNINDFEVDIL